MNRISLALALALGTMTTVAWAETTVLTDTQMDVVTAGKFATEQGQGNVNNDNVKDNPGTVTVTGPKGQVDKGRTDCNNCTTTGPGGGN